MYSIKQNNKFDNGGITLRMSRLRRFKTRKKLILASKIIAVFYLLAFSMSYIVSGTGAYFTNENKEKQEIQAGTWWDQSNLVFTRKSTQKVKTCSPTEISVQIKNKGFSMIDSTKYEIYYSENGNPKDKGKKIDDSDGTIQPIKKDGTKTITFNADKNGSYRFKVFQRPGYDNDYDSTHKIWSETITVACIEEDEQKAQDTKPDDQEDKDSSVEEPEENSDSDNKNDSKDENSQTDESEAEEDATENNASDESKEEDPSQKTESNNKESKAESADKSKEPKQENETQKKEKTKSDNQSNEGDKTNEQGK